MWYTIKQVGSAIQPWAVTIGVIWGLGFWRKRSRTGDEIALIVEALEVAYEAQSALNDIRSPMGSSSEISEEENRLEVYPRTAATVRARFRRHEGTFSKLHQVRFRVRARFGDEAAKPLGDLLDAANDVARAGYLLGTIGRGTTFRDETARLLQRQEAIVYRGFGFDDNGELLKVDETARKIDEAVSTLELKLRPLLPDDRTWWAQLKAWRKSRAGAVPG